MCFLSFRFTKRNPRNEKIRIVGIHKRARCECILVVTSRCFGHNEASVCPPGRLQLVTTLARIVYKLQTQRVMTPGLAPCVSKFK